MRPPGPGRSGRPVRTSTAEPQGQRARPPVDRSAPSGEPSARGAAPASPVRRTSFFLLLLGLLGGSLVCLLVVNTTLAANSIRISDLQQQNATRTQQIQQLRQQVAAERSAATIEQEARRLGMRPDPALIFVDLRTKSIQGPQTNFRRTAAGGRALTKSAGRPGR